MTNDAGGIPGLQATSSMSPQLSQDLDASTLAVHADDQLNQTTDVAPAIHVSTTFRYSQEPNNLVTASELKVCRESDLFDRDLQLLVPGSSPNRCTCIFTGDSSFMHET